mgnify:CR=1 FL=1
MNKLASIMAYFCKNYPFKHEISNARLTKMVYLADWLSTQKYGYQLTDIKWYFDNYGPFVHDIEKEAYDNPKFEIISGMTVYGTPKRQIQLVDTNISINIPVEVQTILDKVINDTKVLNWNDFIKFIYNTAPVRNSYRYSYLDLNQS